MFGFEKLDVWQKAVEYACTIYDTTKAFPDEERFGLTSQLRRSSVSAPQMWRKGHRAHQAQISSALLRFHMDRY